MNNDFIKTIQELENTAQKIAESSKRWGEINEVISRTIDRQHSFFSTFEKYPTLTKLGLAQSALDNGAFHKQVGLAKEVERMCEPYRAAHNLVVTYNNDLSKQMKMTFADLVQPERYVRNSALTMHKCSI